MALKKTLTRSHIADAIHNQVGLSRSDSSQLVSSVIDTISKSLVDGDNVKISGFGSFLLRDKAARVGRNPKTGVEVTIAPRRVLTFRASQTMRSGIANDS